jgi:hypothetical protein
MSEYQYYEFRAVDRPLTSQELGRLRTLSTRARISSTSFVNVYNYGDFRVDPDRLVEKYFDAFVYVANWGSHYLTLRLPKDVFAPSELAPFCDGESFRAWSKAGYTILSFRADELENDYGDSGEGWMDALLPVRAELLRAGSRALYLGWLLALQHGAVDDDQPEPPLPPGLSSLSSPLRSLSEFLGIDEDLIESAAELSPNLDVPALSREKLSNWIAALPEPEKNVLLLELATGEKPNAIGQLMRRFDRECVGPAAGEPRARRTAGELLAAADRLTKEKALREEQRLQAERQAEEQEKAAERAKYLDSLVEREAGVWERLDPLIATKRPDDYDRAVSSLVDLRDLAARKGCTAVFQERLRNLRARHAAKSSLLGKLNQAGLVSTSSKAESQTA